MSVINCNYIPVADESFDRTLFIFLICSLGSDKEMQLELARRRLAAKRERVAANRASPEPVKSMDRKYSSHPPVECVYDKSTF